MKTIAQLEREADRKNTVFADQLTNTIGKLSPRAMASSVLDIVDPDFSKLKQMTTRTAQNPFALLTAFAGLYLLVRQVSKPLNSQSSATPARRPRRLGIKPKGDIDGQYISSE